MKDTSYCVVQVAVTVIGPDINIEALALVELESPDQATKTY
jgi:hypothetical protein